MGTTRVIGKYLERYADPAAAAVTLPSASYRAAVVIPARDENAVLGATLRRIYEVAPDVLTIVVVNVRGDDRADVGARSAALLREVQAMPQVLALDHASPGRRFGANEGVGRARRIGADVALRLYDNGQLASSTLYFTDADAHVPDDYMERGALGGDSACAVFPFVHAFDGDAAQNDAIAAYEASQRLYALGLHHAGSPHAYCTLGSTITTRAEAYAHVRGMPLRTAGEDFHYLDKSARVGALSRLGGAPLVLSSRPSRRVPFGTGPSVARLIEAGPAAQMSLHPDAYASLQAALTVLDGHITGESAPRPDADTARASAVRDLAALGVSTKLIAAFAPLTTAAQRRRAAHTVFSALRTRQYLHRVRDDAEAKAPHSGVCSVFDAARAAPFLNDATRSAAENRDAPALCGALRELCALRLVGPCGPSMWAPDTAHPRDADPHAHDAGRGVVKWR